MNQETHANSNGSSAAQAKQLVVGALEDSRYDWRSLDGVAQQTGLTLDEIRHAIDGLQDEIVRSSVPDEKGRELYTTRKHYRETHGLGSRILAALSDKVA